MEQTIAKPTTAEVDAAEKVITEAIDGHAPDGYWRDVAEDALTAAAGVSHDV